MFEAVLTKNSAMKEAYCETSLISNVVTDKCVMIKF